jgi:hypothetical protein
MLMLALLFAMKEFCLVVAWGEVGERPRKLLSFDDIEGLLDLSC